LTSPQARVVEMVGPAGSGKTTLVRALKRQHPPLVTGIRLSKLRLAPYFVAHGLLLLPTYLLRHRDSRWLSRRELRAMAYVKAWHRALSRQHRASCVTVFDHGPVFRLVRLRTFGPELVRSGPFTRWWESALAEWSTMLDAIVWLDAPDEALAQRIQSRQERHRMKAETEDDIRGFLAKYRESYTQVLSELETIRPIPILRFRTDELSAEAIADAVSRDLDLAACVLRESQA
jgi:shikimate kinase